MITREQKFRVEAFLVVAVLLLIAILVIFLGPQLQDEGETYFINFRKMSVNGVNEGSDVKYQGVRVGKVSRVDVNPDDLDSILLYVEIRKSFSVKKDMKAKLQYLGITGLRFVEIYGGKKESDILPPGGEIGMEKGVVEKAEDIVVSVESLADALNEILKEENQEKLSQILGNIEKSTGVLARLLEKKEKNLGNFIENIDKASGELKQFSANLNTFSRELNDLTEKIQASNLVDNGALLVERLSRRLSDQELGETIKTVNRFFKTADTSFKKIETDILNLSDEIIRTLDNMKESLDNIYKFTRELAEDPTVLIRTRTEKRSKK